MNKKIITLAISDFKLIFRDSSLRVFLAMPLVLFAVFIWFLPIMVAQYEFLTPYLSLFLIVGVIENTQMFSFISSMVLIDEKETDVAKVYGIVPLSKVEYIVSRLLIPFLITVVLNIILIKLQSFYTIDWGTNVVISVLTALVVPVYVLGINSIVENRMQGIVYIKAFNMIVLLPIASFFLPENLKHILGFLPTHWIFQLIHGAANNTATLPFLLVGFLFLITLLIWVSKQFIRKHFV
ncbi:MAG: hypothetical protein COA58_11655 [Bacteroidetes bacterium]|nr:MAG: hypothetical protein COA58_11655 [Bacteroidota bacterium]